MSQENVEIVRESFLATGSGDPAAAQAVRERSFDQSIEWDMSGVIGWTEKEIYRGREVGLFLQAWADSWRTWHFDLDEVRDAGEEQVFAAIHERIPQRLRPGRCSSSREATRPWTPLGGGAHYALRSLSTDKHVAKRL